MGRCFQIHAEDNVATVLDSDADEALEIMGPASASVLPVQRIQAGHKVALRAISEGDRIVKYGVAIGIATREIARGEWVHLHNCRSQFDERSSSLNALTGAPQDTPYV